MMPRLDAMMPRRDAITPRLDAMMPRLDAMMPWRDAITPRRNVFSPNGTVCGSHGREPMVTGQTPASEAPTGRHDSLLLPSLWDFALMGGPRSMGSRPWLHHAVPSGLRPCVVLRRKVCAVDEATRSGCWLDLRQSGICGQIRYGMMDLWPDPLRDEGSVARSTTGFRDLRVMLGTSILASRPNDFVRTTISRQRRIG